MNKVTTVNLNGQAYQVEEKAYKALGDYLDRAKRALGDDPDKAEIISDIEQSIADKCDRYLSKSKNVVSEGHMDNILEAMGPVESAETEADDGQKAAEGGEKPRKLYIIKEGAMVFGVCNGLGAYFGVPANVIRVLFVLLTFLTSGIWILLYLVLALVLPVADSDDKLAEAYGRPTTAKQVVDRAKERLTNPEALNRAGSIIMRIWRILAKLVTLFSAVVVAGLTVGLIMALWAIGLHRVNFHGSLASLNGWHQWLFVSAVYVVAVVPPLLIARLFNRIADERPQTKRSNVGDSTMAVLWGVAIATVVSFVAIYTTDFRNYVNSHNGYMDIGNSHLCVDRPVCHPDDSESGPFVRPSKEIPAMPLVPTN